MKKDSLFMWAYISFALVCVIVRLFLDYSQWTPLLLAITISTLFFAVNDLFTSLEKTFDDLCDVTESILISGLRKKIKEVSDRAQDTVYWMFNSEVDSEFDSEKCEQIMSCFERYVKRRRTIQNVCQKIADICFYFGFLFFLLTFVIASLITISAVMQEILTVFSFAIMLIARQIDDGRSEKLHKEMIEYQEVLEEIIGGA